MTGWRHDNGWAAEHLNPACTGCMADHLEDDPLPPDAICTAPTPDPASPCGFEGCASNHAQTLHAIHRFQEQTCWHVPEVWCHPHVPTRCFCGHSLQAILDAR